MDTAINNKKRLFIMTRWLWSFNAKSVANITPAAIIFIS